MNVNKVAARASNHLIKKHLMVAEYKDVYGDMGAPPLPRKDGLPMNKSKQVAWRRYENIPVNLTPLAEGVTPEGNTISWTDITVDLTQYGDFVYLSDLSLETVEDALMDVTGLRQENQSVRTMNQIRCGVLIAGTTVLWSGGTSTITVDELITKALIGKIERTLNLNMANKLTKIIAAGQGIATVPIPDSFIGVCHEYTRYDFVNSITESGGYTPVHKYSQQKPLPMECGTISETRFKVDPDMTFLADGGDTKGSGHKSTSGVKEDVFYTLIFAEEAYGITPFSGYGGKDGIKAIVKPLGEGDDPLNQRATSGWKTFQAIKILNDEYMGRIEHGVTA